MPTSHRSTLNDEEPNLFLTCVEITCRHKARLSFDELAMPDDTLFPDIAKCRKFICTKCGRRKVELMPCWDTVKAHGKPEY